MNNNTGMNIPTNTSWSRKGRRVLCLETNKIYNSTTEAAKANNICQSLVSDVCRGKWKSAKGLHFHYVDEHNAILSTPEIPVTEKEIVVSKPSIIKGKGKCNNGNTNAVMCISTGEIFTSCTDAANANNVTVGHMSTVCRGKGRSAKGKQYCYIKDIDMHLDEISDAISKKNAYQELLAKENRRKQLRNMIADYKGDISRLESELNSIRSKMESARAELENL